MTAEVDPQRRAVAEALCDGLGYGTFESRKPETRQRVLALADKVLAVCQPVVSSAPAAEGGDRR